MWLAWGDIPRALFGRSSTPRPRQYNQYGDDVTDEPMVRAATAHQDRQNEALIAGTRLTSVEQSVSIKACPYCATTIQGEAVFCPYCRHDLAVQRAPEPQQLEPKAAAAQPVKVSVLPRDETCSICGGLTAAADQVCPTCRDEASRRAASAPVIRTV